MDLVLKLREIRRLRGLSQKDVARLSGVGEKTISSFETGQRIGSLKLAQLNKMLGVYGLTEAEFFGCSVERQIAPWELNDEESAAQRLVEELRGLPGRCRKRWWRSSSSCWRRLPPSIRSSAPTRPNVCPTNAPRTSARNPSGTC